MANTNTRSPDVPVVVTETEVVEVFDPVLIVDVPPTSAGEAVSPDHSMIPQVMGNVVGEPVWVNVIAVVPPVVSAELATLYQT